MDIQYHSKKSEESWIAVLKHLGSAMSTIFTSRGLPLPSFLNNQYVKAIP